MEVVHGGTGAIEWDDGCYAVAGNDIKDVGAKAIVRQHCLNDERFTHLSVWHVQ
jgi:hypothetical protein